MSREPIEYVMVKGKAEPRRIGIRAAIATDQSYIARTWASSILDGPRMHSPAEVRHANLIVDKMLDDPQTRILVACEPTDANKIIGWIAFARVRGARTLLYINVRHQERREGIGTELVRAAGLQVNGSPIVYLWDGPSSSWAKGKRPDAIKIDPAEYLP